MEALSSSAAILSSSSSSSLSFFSQKRKDPSFRILRCHPSSSKNNGDNSDHLRSGSDPNEPTSIVPFFNRNTLSKDDAMGLVLSAASLRGWTTGSGMEGPPAPAGAEGGANTEKVSTLPWSLFTKSPRRRMRVAFTCNVCGQRTTRAINPHAYTDGTVFVQCCGCNVFHKLVDNLNLFHEMKCYVNPDFKYQDSKWDLRFRLFDDDDHDDDDDNASYPI
ncbi:DNL-type zinc finger protein [Linum grandiflorum]